MADDEEVVCYSAVPLFGSNRNETYMLSDGRRIASFARSVNTVSHDSSQKLFADHVWPGSLVLADWMDKNSRELCVNKNVIELGAGTALPSLVAAKLSAKLVVTTDFPEDSILQNIQQLVNINQTQAVQRVMPHKWGEDCTNLLELIDKSAAATMPTTRGYDVVIVAECLWKDTYVHHSDLLQSVAACLHPERGVALVSFVHRPTAEHTEQMDMEFFQRAFTHFGMESIKIRTVTDKYKDVDETEYAKVHLFSMRKI